MLETYLQATLPPAHVVAPTSPAAAEKIRAVSEREQGRGSDGPSLEELRREAFAEFGSEFVDKLASEEAALVATLAADLDTLWAHWNRLEQLNGLRHWAGHGQRLYASRPIALLEINSGWGGHKTPVTARQLLDAFHAAIVKGGH